MVVHEFPKLFLVRDPQPVASYIRPSSRDFRHLSDYLSAGYPGPTGGIVIDARYPERIADLLKVSHSKGIGVVLDPLSVELSTPGGIARSGMRELPWALSRAQKPSDFTTDVIRQVAQQIATTAAHMGANAVLAPTHLLDSSVSAWLPRDLELTLALRAALDEEGGNGIEVYYPLIGRLQTLLEPTPALTAHFEQLSRLQAIDAIWLRVAGYDVRAAGPTLLSRYVATARSLHQYGIPVVAERTGVFGIALAAFGAVAGFESGIASGQRYDPRELMKPPKPGAAMQPLRVYLPTIGAFMNRKDAEAFLKHPAVKNWFVCQDPCCRNGASDMISDPRRHFLVARSVEVEKIAAVPPELRASQYLENWLRPASDRATRAARVMEQLRAHRDRLDSWRVTLSELLEKDQAARPSTSAIMGSLPRKRGAL